MALPFRQRIFVVLVALTAVPTALAVVGWALAVRTVGPSAGARVALEEMAASARQMVDRIDTTHLALRERAAVRDHLARLSTSVTRARRRPRAGARGRAAAGVPRGGAARRARDQESAHVDADRGGPAGANGGTGGPPDGDRRGSAGCRDATAGPAGEGVRRLRPAPG